MARTDIDVLGIGNAIVDVLATCEDAKLVQLGVEKGSMNLIDEARANAIYADMGPAQETSGGSAANTVAGVASLGGRPGYIGRVRNDQLGAIFAHDIRAVGAAFETPMAEEGPSTAQCLVLITPDGERTMNTYLGACVELTENDVPEDMIARSAITYLEGYLWDPPNAKRAFQKAVTLARKSQRQVALTLSDSFCVERHRDSFLELIRNGIDLLFANEAEILSLYQVTSIDEAITAVKEDCGMAVVTRSEKGCIVVQNGKAEAYPVHPVREIVDLTGAGDHFAAGFMFGLIRDMEISECARIGAIAAAEIISQIGARPRRPLAELI